MEEVVLRGAEWDSGPVRRAESFWERLRGLRGVGDHESVIIRTKSVHAIGLKQPFRAVGLTDDLVVADIRLVRPGRVVLFPGCRYVLELPVTRSHPPRGSVLRLSHG